jgi:hypothetical protein
MRQPGVWSRGEIRCRDGGSASSRRCRSWCRECAEPEPRCHRAGEPRNARIEQAGRGGVWPGVSRPGCDSRCLVRMKLVAEFRIEALVRLGDGFRVGVSSDWSARPPPPLPARRSTGTPDHENPGSAGPGSEKASHRVARMRTSRHRRGDVRRQERIARCPRSQATPRRSFGGYAAPVPARRGLIDGEVTLPGLDFDRSVAHRNPELPSLPGPRTTGWAVISAAPDLDVRRRLSGRRPPGCGAEHLGITLHGLTVARRVRRWCGTPAAPRSPPGSSGLTAASASPARLP